MLLDESGTLYNVCAVPWGGGCSGWGLLEPYRLGGGGHNVPPLFLICLGSNCNQTWHAATLGQNLSKSIKISLTSLLGAKYAVIKPFLVSFQVNIQILLLYPVELKFGTGVNSEVLISNSSQNI